MLELEKLLKHNVFIIWNPDYNLKIPIIDDQHRGIVTIINSLYFGIQNEYIDDMLVPIIDMINDYTKIHFQIEEDLLERCRFPDAEKHRALHDELISKLVKIGRRSALEKDPYQFLDFLKTWWINHICVEDLVFQKYLTEVS